MNSVALLLARTLTVFAAVHDAAEPHPPERTAGLTCTTHARATFVTRERRQADEPPFTRVEPVLEFPEAGLDDVAAYRGYQTRFYRDAAGNTVQVYVNQRDGRVVNLWADADDESVGFTARRAGGPPAELRWSRAEARVAAHGRTRIVEYELRADARAVFLGHFLLGSMRVERDFQYSERHRAAFDDAPFLLPEIEQLLTALTRLDPRMRGEHLALLNAGDADGLRARATASLDVERGTTTWTARLTQPSLDARDTLWLEIAADTRLVTGSIAGDSVILRARSGTTVPFTVRVATTATPLTRLTRAEIFTPDFLAFLARADPRSIRGRWLERQVRGVELLSSREKLMAGLPNYATYFGRDMLMSALMMRDIWRAEMSEFAIASALRKLGPRGDVSHEEAMGGQAVRESAAEYARLVDASLSQRRLGRADSADGLLSRAGRVLAAARRTRENYHMIDDEFQLPVLASRWLADSSVSRERKRAFLLDTADYGEARLARLLRELALVAEMTAAYAAQPDAANLVPFPVRDSTHWESASWRDSGAGYAAGRFAMDVNAIWAPSALDGIATIFAALRDAGLPPDSLAGVLPELRAGSTLGTYARDSLALRRAVDTWWGARRHFVVRLAPPETRRAVTARLATFAPAERAYWQGVMRASRADDDPVEFLALSLDGAGRPIAVANTDPATSLFLGHDGRAAPTNATAAAQVLRDVRPFVLRYPVGLFVDRVGPLVVNDAYATPAVWAAFDRDLYHGPRVVWGREVNLFLLGVAGAIEAARAAPGVSGATGSLSNDGARAAYLRALRGALTQVLAAVEGSGFKSELWSYEFRNGAPEPRRYSTGSDVQLWSTTDLAVQYALARLRIR